MMKYDFKGRLFVVFKSERNQWKKIKDASERKLVYNRKDAWYCYVFSLKNKRCKTPDCGQLSYLVLLPLRKVRLFCLHLWGGQPVITPEHCKDFVVACSLCPAPNRHICFPAKCCCQTALFQVIASNRPSAVVVQSKPSISGLGL